MKNAKVVSYDKNTLFAEFFILLFSISSLVCIKPTYT